MESQSETSQTVSALKLLDVIVNGDSVIPVASTSAGAEGPIPPKTTEQKLARKNELKAKSTLMLAIPDEHLLKFHACKDAKSLWEAIKNRFGGNKESKKMQKTILKQNYENFAASSQEGLDKIYDRFQKLINQLEVNGEVISHEDANLKLLRSLPSAWNNIALIMRNKSNLDELSMDDLYNNLKMYESEIKGKSSSSSNSQNVAFVSSDNSSSTNETVNTAHSVLAGSTKDQASTASYADHVMFSFFSNQSNAPQLDNEDLEQINADDLEKKDLKWQVAMLTMRVKRFIKKTGRKLDLNDKETVGFDKTKVECYNYHRRGYFARECRAPRNQGNKNRDALRRNAPMDTSTTNALVVQDGIGYQIGLESLEARIVVHEKNETVYEEDIAFLKYDVQVKDISIKELKINKTGLGFDEQVNEGEVLDNVFDSRESDRDDNTVNDRFKKVDGYHVVPPPYTRNYMPSRPDLSFAGLDDFVYKTKQLQQSPSGQVPVNAAKQSSPRAATSISTARPVNTDAPKPKVNDALPITYSYFKAHSRENAVQSSHAGFGDQQEMVIPTKTLQDQGIFNSGCSRHMTGNKSFLTIIKKYLVEFVAFRGSPTGGIKRKFSVSRTPQQNGFGLKERKDTDRATRTVLADFIITYNLWAEAVRTPSISFMRPFGCPVTILNTLDPLVKFDGKADESWEATSQLWKQPMNCQTYSHNQKYIGNMPKYQIIGDINSATQTRRMIKISEEHAMINDWIIDILEGQPKLGLWYPRDSPFDLEAFSDSDYAGASLDRKSTTGGIYLLAWMGWDADIEGRGLGELCIYDKMFSFKET
ncbi:hypothetical protein Tco_1068830 [Tanacetum coccineum]|uniref:Uncharacterized protein n=1 Tax=Tanacetum coccineum TaxID=301880 RepID=A0ABQ5HIY0_9ASTR